MKPDRPTKILYCIDALVRGGTELQLLGLIERLDRRRFQPYLLTVRPSEDMLEPVDCEHLDWRVPKLVAPAGMSAVARLATFLRNEDVVIVQTFFQDSTVLGAAAAMLARVPVRLASFRDLGFWRTPSQQLLMRSVYPLLTGFLCNSDSVRDHIVARDGIATERITVIRNGVDAHALPWVDRDGPTRSVGIVGNLTRQVKRTDLFIKAAAAISKRYPDVMWHVVGDGHLRPGLEELASDQGLGDRVVFAGRIDDAPAYLSKLDVGVICSDSEGLSNAMIEYMYRGVAVVATDVGGNRELIRHEQTGLLVPPDDVENLARAIERYIEDVALRRRVAAAARRSVQETYNWESCVEAHMNYYDRARMRCA